MVHFITVDWGAGSQTLNVDYIERVVMARMDQNDDLSYTTYIRMRDGENIGVVFETSKQEAQSAFAYINSELESTTINSRHWTQRASLTREDFSRLFGKPHEVYHSSPEDLLERLTK